METFGLRRQAQAGRASSHGHAGEAAVVTWEQAGDERTEAEDRRLGLRPALADEKELIRRGRFGSRRNGYPDLLRNHNYVVPCMECNAAIFSAVASPRT